jgi:hypothetical protein
MGYKLMKYKWVIMRNGQDTELKAEKYGKEILKTVEKLGCKKYTRAKIVQVNIVLLFLLCGIWFI